MSEREREQELLTATAEVQPFRNPAFARLALAARAVLVDASAPSDLRLLAVYAMQLCEARGRLLDAYEGVLRERGAARTRRLPPADPTFGPRRR